MHRSTALKILAGTLIVWLIINLVLFGLGRISSALFWATIAVFALIAYKGIPMLRKV